MTPPADVPVEATGQGAAASRSAGPLCSDFASAACTCWRRPASAACSRPRARVDVASISLPVQADRKRVNVAGGGAKLVIRLTNQHLKMCRKALSTRPSLPVSGCSRWQPTSRATPGAPSRSASASSADGYPEVTTTAWECCAGACRFRRNTVSGSGITRSRGEGCLIPGFGVSYPLAAGLAAARVFGSGDRVGPPSSGAAGEGPSCAGQHALRQRAGGGAPSYLRQRSAFSAERPTSPRSTTTARRTTCRRPGATSSSSPSWRWTPRTSRRTVGQRRVTRCSPARSPTCRCTTASRT